jgi:hypothetical protein
MSSTKTKTSEADNARFNEIEGIVMDPGNRDRLRAAETTAEIRDIATAAGVDTGRNSKDMGKLIHKLKLIGVDYPALSKQEAAARRAELADRAATLDGRADDLSIVRLWSAAVESDTDQRGSFAILDAEGAAVWFDTFSPKFERIRTPGDLVSAEQSAADKAVYVASKARQAAGLDEVALWLTTTCPELNTDRLKQAAARQSVAVEVIVDPDDTEAVEMAELPGSRWLKNVPDAELVALVESQEEVADEVPVEPFPDGFTPESTAAQGGDDDE